MIIVQLNTGKTEFGLIAPLSRINGIVRDQSALFEAAISQLTIKRIDVFVFHEKFGF